MTIAYVNKKEGNRFKDLKIDNQKFGIEDLNNGFIFYSNPDKELNNILNIDKKSDLIKSVKVHKLIASTSKNGKRFYRRQAVNLQEDSDEELIKENTYLVGETESELNEQAIQKLLNKINKNVYKPGKYPDVNSQKSQFGLQTKIKDFFTSLMNDASNMNHILSEKDFLKAIDFQIKLHSDKKLTIENLSKNQKHALIDIWNAKASKGRSNS